LLQAADVVYSYYGRAPVVRGVSLAVPAGSFVGILGPNGSGKTTLLRLLSGALRPSAGVITLDGDDLSRLPQAALARRMAVVPQETQLAFDFSVLEVVLMGRYPHLGTFEVEGPADFAIARESLAATGTLALQDRPFATLSGGEKQRVIIAAALAQIHHGSTPPHRKTRGDPGAAGQGKNILLLDEPTAALDLAYQLELTALLRDLQQRLPIAIVVSTHDLNFAASLCRTLVMLRDGHVVATGQTDTVLTRAHIRDLYGVDAEVYRHADTGRLVVIPLSRTAREPDA
jgi:cobalamin transport system ATP-binding protein